MMRTGRPKAEGLKESKVYISKIPLVGLEFAGSLLGDLYPEELLHWMVVVQHPNETICGVYDFLPLDPLSPVTAATLLAGGSVPGELRTRKLSQVPRTKGTRSVGMIRRDLGAPVEVDKAIKQFQTSYNSSLALDQNDCRDHVSALVKFLVEKGEATP